MTFPRRTMRVAAIAALLSVGSAWASCALPGYTLGDTGGAQGGAGGAGQSASSSGGAGGLSGSSSASSSSGVGGAGGAGGGQTGGGGAGGGGCTVDEDCKSFGTLCKPSVCDKSGGVPTCVTKALSDPALNLKPKATGDCSMVVCMNGIPTKVPDNQDPDIDENPCTLDVCTNGMVDHSPANGAQCTLDSGMAGLCKFGQCVQCVNGQGCAAGFLCQSGRCVPSSCGNLMHDNAETGKDCGGPECQPCMNGMGCLTNDDCSSKRCVAGKCEMPLCNDGLQDGEEVGVDCGALCPNKCDTGAFCRGPMDCASGVCRGSVCQAPSCDDWVVNQGEGPQTPDCGLVCQIACP